MSEPFLAEIRMFGCSYAPRNWAFCNGQLLPIAQNSALFSLVGTIYGGNGVSTFGLPNLQGRMPVQWGNGPGLSTRSIGEQDGVENVTLPAVQMPAHSHTLKGGPGGTQQSPSGSTPGLSPSKGYHPGPATGSTAALLQPAGSSAAHNNMSPYATLNFCIALAGVYPPRP